jgi:hypothetical protein
MITNKMTLSIVAFVGSVLLFIGATFAWILYQYWVDAGETTHTVVNVDASAGLEISYDGIEYDSVTSVATQNKVPGDIVFYRLYIENTGNTLISIRVKFYGFIISVNNPSKDDTNFQNGNNLVNAILLSATNDIDSVTVDNILLADAIGNLPLDGTYETATLILFNNIIIPEGDNVTIVFTFTFSPTSGNEYQNLKLSIDSIIIDAVAE